MTLPKKIVTVHDCIHIKYPELYPKGNPPILATIESLSPGNDYAICVSEATRSDFLSFIEMPKHHTCVIPSSADSFFFDSVTLNKSTSEFFFKHNIESKQYIFALAQAEPRKNIERLIKAFAIFVNKKRGNQIPLVLVAHYKYQDYFMKLFNDNNVSHEHFRVLSNVDENALVTLYQNALLFAYVSLYEGFGLPILEAMASGCPVMLSNSSSLPEVGGTAGYYINPMNTHSIADGLNKLVENLELRQTMIDAGKKQAAKFSWQATAKKTVDFYQYVLKQIPS